MAFVPTVESAQKQINASRVIYQDALAAVAEGRAKLQAAVDSGQVQTGTQEYLNLKNQLVNSAEAQAETAKMQYDQDLSNLDNARAYAAGDTSVLGIDTGNNNYVAPAENPQVSNNETPIIGAGNINVSSAQVSNTVADTNDNTIPDSAIRTAGSEDTGFVYGTNGELVPADSVAGEQAIADQNLALDQDIINQANAEPSYYPEASDTESQQIVQDQMAGEGYFGTPYDDDGNLNPGWELDGDGNPYYIGTNTKTGSLWINPNTAASAEASRVAAFRDQAQRQQTISQQRRTPNNGDWRVKLRLAPKATYLYNAPNPGILQPLKITDGIIFPYTPSIDTAYRANYSTYDLTHSNYRGYFYQNSYVDAINLRCTFTAQDTAEADYLLAVIHFFRSVTKMFYGQDAERGAPTPLTYLSGLGEYQFNEHPCLVQQFNYTLPPDIDYVRAGSPNNNNTNLNWNRARQSVVGGGFLGPLLGGALQRLANAGAPKGALSAPPPPPTLGLNRPTYVPTKMEIAITLLPIQSRNQVSKQFSLKQFSSGDLLKGGFW